MKVLEGNVENGRDDGEIVVFCATESDINGQQRRIWCCNETMSSLVSS